MGGVAERSALAVFVAGMSAATSIANLTGSLKVLDVTGSTLLLSLAVLTYNVLFTLMSWFWPRLFLGRLKRRGLLTVSSIGAGLGLLAMGASNSYPVILLGSGMSGAFAALVYPVMITVLADYYGKDAVAVTRYNTYSSIGFIMGYVAAATARELISTSALLIISSAVTMGLSPLTLVMPQKYLIVEPRRVSYISIIPQLTGRLRPIPSLILTPKVVYNLGRLFRDLARMMYFHIRRKLPLTMLATTVLFTAIGMFFTPMPAILRSSGLNDTEVYLVYLLSSTVSTASYRLMHGVISRVEGAWKSLIAASSIRSALFLLPTYLPLIGDLRLRVVVITTCFSVIGATWAAISSSLSTVVLSMSERERREERLGHLNAVIGLGTILGSLLAGPVTQWYGYGYEALIASALIAAASVMYYKAMKALIT